MLSIRNNSSGQIALPFILLVGGIIIEIVIAGSIIAIFINNSSIGERLSLRALTAANTGVYDAIEKISSNKEFYALGEEYEITVGEDTVTVTVSREVDNNNNVYNYTVSSVSNAGTRKRRVVADLLVNQTTGELSLSSIREVPVQ